MMEKAYKFKVHVQLPDKSQRDETHIVSEPDTRFGEAFACGKCVRYYEGLKEKKEILDYRLYY